MTFTSRFQIPLWQAEYSQNSKRRQQLKPATSSQTIIESFMLAYIGTGNPVYQFSQFFDVFFTVSANQALTLATMLRMGTKP